MRLGLKHSSPGENAQAGQDQLIGGNGQIRGFICLKLLDSEGAGKLAEQMAVKGSGWAFPGSERVKTA